jgi:hypothetical protein
MVIVAAGLIGFAAVSFGLIVAILGRMPEARDFTFPRYLVIFPAMTIGSIVSMYCNAIVTEIAGAKFDGRELSTGAAAGMVTKKLPQLIGWALLAGVVGLVLQAVAERLKLGGRIATRLVGLAWTLATVFVLPILLFEDVGVTESVGRSARLFKARWGESVSATGGIAVAMLVVMIPIMLVGAILLVASVGLGVAVLAVAIAGVMVLSAALGSVVNVALYRYAVDGSVLGGFTADELAGSYVPKKKRF